jgi:hypothetical protein
MGENADLNMQNTSLVGSLPNGNCNPADSTAAIPSRASERLYKKYMRTEMSTFDAATPVAMQLAGPGGIKTVRVRFPNDEEWAERQRRRKAVVKNLGYAPRWIRPCRSLSRASRSCPYSSHVIPSTPGAARFFRLW